MDETTLEIKDVKNYWIQPKLNGIFARWDGKNLYTSGDNVITAVPHVVAWLKKVKFPPTEGELYNHGTSFQKIYSLVINGKKIDEDEVIWFYEHKAIKRFRAKTNKDLQRLYNRFLKGGYEGVVLTHVKTGQQYKIKPTPDAEATLIGFHPAKGARNKATFGSLILRLDNGVEFKCGGIKDVDREALWKTKPIGARINFIYWEFSDGGVPKMARFRYVRTDKNFQKGGKNGKNK